MGLELELGLGRGCLIEDLDRGKEGGKTGISIPGSALNILTVRPYRLPNLFITYS